MRSLIVSPVTALAFITFLIVVALSFLHARLRDNDEEFIRPHRRKVQSLISLILCGVVAVLAIAACTIDIIVTGVADRNVRHTGQPYTIEFGSLVSAVRALRDKS